MKWNVIMLSKKEMLVTGTVVFVTLATLINAQPWATAQTLSKGIHVEMAATHFAMAMPAADESDALIAAITNDGAVYLGTEPTTPSALVTKRDVFSRAHDQLYVKADARVSFATVMEVLEAARSAGITTPRLLTNQPGPRTPGKIEPPRGLEVSLASAGRNLPPSVEVKVVQTLQGGALVQIDNRETPWTKLPSELKEHLQKAAQKSVIVLADGRVDYAQVVRAIDLCRAEGASVYLAKSRT